MDIMAMRAAIFGGPVDGTEGPVGTEGEWDTGEEQDFDNLWWDEGGEG